MRAIETVGPQEIAQAFEMKETIVSKRGIGFGAASRSRINKFGEKKIIGYAEDGERVSLRIQLVDVKMVLGSVRKMNTGGNVVALGGDESYAQNKETNEKTRINYEQGQHVSCEGDGEGVEGQSFRDIGHGERGSSGFHTAACKCRKSARRRSARRQGAGRRRSER